jgi:hypothetical protein
MRIRKSPRKESALQGVRNTIALTPHERLIWKDVNELISSSDKEIAGQLYVDHVMKPLLGSKYVDAGVCSHCSHFQLNCFYCHIGNTLTQNGCFYHHGCAYL